MFTGIIEAVGRVVAFERPGDGARSKARSTARLVIDGRTLAHKIRVSESVLVDGVCLTVAHKTGSKLAFDLAHETLRRTNLHRLTPGARVNLEDSLREGEPLGGHFVYGHIDGTLKVIGWNGELLWLERPSKWSRFIVEKGSVAINGISLTVARTQARRFAVAIIPFTRTHTNLNDFAAGDRVNFEIDPLARYRAASRRKVTSRS